MLNGEAVLTKFISIDSVIPIKIPFCQDSLLGKLPEAILFVQFPSVLVVELLLCTL